MPRARLSPVDREILTLAVPALGALIAEPLYVLADTAVGGHLGTAQLGGLAVASGALLFVYGLCIFLAYGTTAAVARLLGAGDQRQAAHQAVQGLWLAGGLGAVLGVVGWAIADPLLRLLGADGPMLDEARIYLRISLLGAPGMLVMLAGVGYLRGCKDNIRPLQVAAGTAVLNLVVELVLIYGFDRGIGASALATAIAQWVGAVWFTAWIIARARHLDVGFAPAWRDIRRLLGVGAELMVRNLALAGTFLAGTSVAARIGDVDVAAHQVAFQIWMVTSLTMDAVAIAAQAMVGNLLGANDPDTARVVGQRVIGWSVTIGIVTGLPLVALHAPLAGIFTADAAVVALAGFLIVHVGAMAPLGGVSFALDGILIGAGDQRFLARAMVLAAMVTLPVMAATRLAGLGIGWLWGTIWLFILARSVILLVRFRGDRWQVVGSGA